MVTATQNIAKTISGAATSTNSTFPLVTVPLIEISGYTGRHEAYVDMFAYSPIVSEAARVQWQDYAVEHMDWVVESRTFLQGKGDDSVPTSSTNTAMRDFIWQANDDDTAIIPSTSSPYLPMWQISPPPAAPDNLVNFNLLSIKYVSDIFAAILVVRGKNHNHAKTMRQHGKNHLFANVAQRSTISSLFASMIEGALSPFQNFEAHLNAIEHADPIPLDKSASILDSSSPEVPRTVYIHPVFRDVTDSSSTVTGLVHGLFSWMSFFENILPSDAKGVYVVLKNTCDQQMTFQVMGKEVSRTRGCLFVYILRCGIL